MRINLIIKDDTLPNSHTAVIFFNLRMRHGLIIRRGAGDVGR